MAALALFYRGRGYAAWTTGGGLLLLAWLSGGVASYTLFGTVTLLFAAAALVGRSADLRRRLLARPAMRVLGRSLPRMSETERIALDAGTVGWDGELFSGHPDWDSLLDVAVPSELMPKKRSRSRSAPWRHSSVSPSACAIPTT
jgi:acyl-CoA dehydrogenase